MLWAYALLAAIKPPAVQELMTDLTTTTMETIATTLAASVRPHFLFVLDFLKKTRQLVDVQLALTTVSAFVFSPQQMLPCH